MRDKRIAIYARYSSELQNESSIADQVARCRQWASERGGTVNEELEFEDRAKSGANTDRPGFEALMRAVTAKPRTIDVIVVEDLSRLSRSSADLFHVQRLLEFEGVRLIGIADGIDTMAEHSVLTFGLKSLVSEIYLKDLRDKTLRGLRGRASRGLSTGGLPLGYRSVRTPDGSRIEIDAEKARLVIRIFELHADGTSLAGIAMRLNDEGVPSPRRKAGWIQGSIRAVLHNAAYVGQWKYGARRWRKVPGTNKRRPVANEASSVMRFERPDLRIVDEALWTAVQDRLAAIHRCYRGGASDASSLTLSGRGTPYLLSGLLFCGTCGGRMQICGGSSARYYRCANASKRGTCANRLSVREDVARNSVLAELKHRLASPAGVAHVRKRIAEKLGELERNADRSRRESHHRKKVFEKQINEIVDTIADGKRSPALVTRLHVLEAELERVNASKSSAVAPIVELPTPERLLELVFGLEARLMADATRGRELLRRLFRNGAITLVPQDGGFYLAKSEVLPLMLLTMPPDAKTPPGQGHDGVRFPLLSCAGAMGALYTGVSLGFERRIAA